MQQQAWRRRGNNRQRGADAQRQPATSGNRQQQAAKAQRQRRRAGTEAETQQRARACVGARACSQAGRRCMQGRMKARRCVGS
eukprot:3842762-Alexandrium_andersonii.AAC.1